ncbi:hypothetical protein MAM1_0019d01706 [Mucor ambiguus]|uniref:Uncharacterized protein n=1 Tax=Mucor ambiguus TaxID=91626 RepID=A0A0C9LRS4_9FUNG|nr:hypothetical protein MAM1_0019d01706 [Mucor ambiguus]
MTSTQLSPPQRPLSKKLNSTSSHHSQQPGTTSVEKTPPRGSESNEKTATIVAHYEEPNMDLLEKDFKITVNDDMMTDDDSDMDEEQDTFMGLSHESTSPAGIHPYHTNSKHDDGVCYHPTAPIIHEDKQMMEQQQGYLNSAHTNVENTLEDNLYERKASFSRRPSQLLQERNSLNALCPPSHVLKARRLSKTIIKPSASTPITGKDKIRKPSIVDNYTKEFGNNSAVSPRFMALRKLSEVTNLPSHSISYSVVPPVPQIPSTYQSTATATVTAAQDEKPSKSPKASADTDQLLGRIDSAIESQLQFHLGQIVWRASESHLDARRFWEEQKKEMFGFAATLIDRMETQVDMQRRMTFESITSESPIEKEEVNIALQQKELSLYKSKYTEAKRQLFELEVLKTRNVELEKQHELDLKTIKQLKEEIAQQNPNVRQDNPQEVIDDKPTYDLKAKNTQLKYQLKHLQEINQQLLEQTTVYEQDKKRRLLEIEQLKEQLSQQQQQRKVQPSASTTTTVDGIDCSEDFGKTKKKPGKQMDNWADMMESEDEAKKSADEWAQKYRELQTSYFEACMKLEKKQVHSDDEKKIFDLNQSLMEKDEMIRHLKQAEEVNKIQLNYLQIELNKCSEKKKKKTPVDNGGYTTEDGYLTFTTEINGQASKYTIKIPNVNHNSAPNPPRQQQRRNTAAFKPTTTPSHKPHLNPYACEWKKSKTKN